MNVKRYSINTNNVHVYLLSDLHIGAANTDYAAIERAVKKIKDDKKAMVFLLGDLVEAIPTRDWRFDAGSEYDAVPKELQVSDLDDFVRGQVKYVKRIFSPVIDKVKLVIAGNHDEKWGRGMAWNITKEISEALDADYANYFCLVQLALKRSMLEKNYMTYNMLLHHGAGGGRRTGSHINRNEDYLMRFENLDLIATGHTHSAAIVVHEKELVRTKNNFEVDIVKKRVLNIKTGGFRGDAFYAEKNMMSQLPSSYVLVKLQTKNRDGRWIIDSEAVIL